MADTRTLAQLRQEVRQRADMEDSEFVSDSELNLYIAESYKELYDLLVKANEDYFTISTTATLSGSDDEISLPADFYKLRGVDYAIDANQDKYITLRRYNFNERNLRDRAINNIYYGIDQLRYHLTKNKLQLVPSGRAGGNYRIWYIPAPNTLSDDADTADGVSGWLEYVVVDACIKALAKEESSTTMFEKQKMDMRERIEKMSVNRDAGAPITVGDTSAIGYDPDFHIWD